MTSNFDCTSFPRAMEGPLNVVWFDSGWVRVAPDTGTDETALGFVVVSDDGQQLAVYHAWGEL